jgi:hypothetical protein
MTDDLHSTMDAVVWAKEFCKRWPSALCQIEGKEGVQTGADFEDTMIGWFANAIMVGYDTANNRAADRIEALTVKVEMFRETNRRMNRRVQLLEGWWQRRLEREKNQRVTIMWLWHRDRANQPLNVKALEEAAYQRGYEDGRDDRFNIPPRRAKPRRKGDTP